jgi:hypothetical protein
LIKAGGLFHTGGNFSWKMIICTALDLHFGVDYAWLYVVEELVALQDGSFCCKGQYLEQEGG